MRKRRVFSLTLAVLVLAAPAGADVIYSYAGNLFTTFTGGYSCPPECSLSGTFEVQQALAANLNHFVFTPIAFSFTDGNISLSNSNTNPTFTNFCVSTSSTGAIEQWGISFPDASVPNTFLFVTDNGCGTSPVIDESAASALCSTCLARQAYNLGDPGIWSPGISSVPEPNSVFLLSAGLLCLYARMIWLQRTGLGKCPNCADPNS